MTITREGKTCFDDEYELNYYVLEELELKLLPDGKILDSNTNEILSFNGMIIKGSVSPNRINYPGQCEIALNLLGNVRMVTVLFGRFLERKMAEGLPFVSHFSDEKIDESDIKYTKLIVKHDTYNFTETEFYHNKCLKFISMIFLLNGEDVELRNFDVTIEDDRGGDM